MSRQALALFLGLAAAAPYSFAQADLPKEPFPLGRPDLIETRTIRELSPGLSYIHLQRRAPEGLPEALVTLASESVKDRAELTKVRTRLESAGYEVNERSFIFGIEKPERYYQLTAGSFKDEWTANKALAELPSTEGIKPEAIIRLPSWDSGPYSLHIAVIDPKKYNGKIVSEWTRRAWRASPMEFALKHNARVGINSSFFEFSENDIGGIPSAISIVQGEWRHEHSKPEWEAVLFIDNDAEEGIKLSFAKPEEIPPMPELKWGNGKSMQIDGIGRMPEDDNELVAMLPSVWLTSRVSHQPPSAYLGYDVLFAQFNPRSGKLEESLLAEYNDGDMYFLRRQSGPILLATGNKRALLREAIDSDGPVEFDLRVPGRPGLNALGLPHIHLRDGVPSLAAESPLVRWSHSVVGWAPDGKIYLFSAVYGIPSAPSTSINISEIVKVASFLGVTNLVSLDGGGTSTSMVVDGKDTENPKQSLFNEDRRVGEAILVIDN